MIKAGESPRMKGTVMKIYRNSSVFIMLCLIFILIFPYYASPQPKDTGKVFKVAILPFIIHSQENLDYLREGINDILTSRITVEGRIIVIERTMIERILWELRPMRLDEAVAKQVGERAGADYVVLGSITKIGNYISLDARLIPITDDKPPLSAYTQHKGIDDVMTKIGDFAQDIGFRILGRRVTTSRPSETRHPYLTRPEREVGRIGQGDLGFKKSQTFNFEIRGIDVGDVDGDKKNEVVVMDHHNLYVFKYDGEKLNLFRKIEIGYQHNFLTLDVADANRNGVAEIIVTSVVEDNLQSFIIEFEQGEFRVITRKSGWFYRVLEHPKEGPLLMGQKMSSEGLPSGPIYRMVWKKKSFERGAKLPFPNESKIFGLTIGDIRNQGKLDILLLDESDRLRIISPEGKVIWKSSSRFGGTNIYYETLKKKEEGGRPHESPPWRVYIPGRILVKDLDSDGISEVILNRNELGSGSVFTRFKTYESGEIYNLVWEEAGLISTWKTREIQGYIVDYQIKDADNDGNQELIVAVALPEEGGSKILQSVKYNSHILFFKLF